MTWTGRGSFHQGLLSGPSFLTRYQNINICASVVSICRGCSSSGKHSGHAQPAPQGGCAGSKRSVSAAVKRRLALYEPALKTVEVKERSSPPSQLKGKAEEAGRFSRRSLLSFRSSAAFLTAASQSSQASSCSTFHLMSSRRSKTADIGKKLCPVGLQNTRLACLYANGSSK